MLLAGIKRRPVAPGLSEKETNEVTYEEASAIFVASDLKRSTNHSNQSRRKK